ncbi:MAG: hypothetical protein AABX70_03990 [Nanoarchaeota archaeon]
MSSDAKVVAALECIVRAQEMPPQGLVSEYGKALELLSEVRTLEHGSPEVLFYEGTICVDLGRAGGLTFAYPAAMAALTQAIESGALEEKLVSTAYFHRGMASLGFGEWCHLQGQYPFAEILFDGAAEDLGKAAERNPNEFVAFMRRGYALNRLGEARVVKGMDTEAQTVFERAAISLDKAIELDKTQGLGEGGVLAYNFAGFSLIRLGRFGEAEKALRVALSRSPNLLPVRVHLGDALRGLERGEKAREQYQFVRTFVAEIPEAKRNRWNWTMAIRAGEGLRKLREDVSMEYEQRAVELGVLKQRDLDYLSKTQI